MARTPGTARLSGTIEALAGGALDARDIVQTKADLTASGSFPYPYIGMETYVVSENKKYRLVNGTDTTVLANWEVEVDDTLSTTSEHAVQNKVIKGALDNKADLVSGKVPASQLPSYVDDVIEGYYNETNGKFYEDSTYTTEIEGEIGKIYVSLDTNKTFRWSGSVFAQVGGVEYVAGDGVVIDDDEISLIKTASGDIDEIVDVLPTGGNIAITGYTPLGTIITYYGETAPKFYLACDGTVYNKTDYPELAKHLLSLTNHSQYEVSGDDTKFKVPDLRGEFLRGTGTNGHTNQGNGANVGVHQDSTAIPKLYTKAGGTEANIIANTTSQSEQQNMDSDYTLGSNTLKWAHFSTTANATGNTKDLFTSRPTNTSVLWCIAYKDIYTNPMNDYSTTEKVVGTWIDGKPLYQKTYAINNPDATWGTNYTHASFGVTDIDYICKKDLAYFQFQHNTSGAITSATEVVYADSSTSITEAITTSCTQAGIRIMWTNPASSKTMIKAIITVQYTKTTD